MATRDSSSGRSDARVSVLAVLALGAISTFLAFVTPNWLASDTRLYGAEFLKLGLWETCFRSFRGIDDTEFRKYFAGCRWIFREEYQTIRSFLMPGLCVCHDSCLASIFSSISHIRVLAVVTVLTVLLSSHFLWFTGFFVATQVLYTMGFVFLLFAVIGTLAIELCFITDREAFVMKVLSFVMFLSGE